MRIDDDTDARLAAAAGAVGKAKASLAADLIRAALDGSDAPPTFATLEEHPLVLHVDAVFENAGLEGIDVSAQREIGKVLARVAAGGGQPAVSAIRELRMLLADVDRLAAAGMGGVA